MNEKMKMGGALCADGGTGDAAGAASVSGKKKYVRPAMTVIPMEAPRLLAASGDRPEVRVYMVYVLDVSGLSKCRISQMTCDKVLDGTLGDWLMDEPVLISPSGAVDNYCRPWLDDGHSEPMVYTDVFGFVPLRQFMQEAEITSCTEVEADYGPGSHIEGTFRGYTIVSDNPCIDAATFAFMMGC